MLCACWPPYSQTLVSNRILAKSHAVEVCPRVTLAAGPDHEAGIARWKKGVCYHVNRDPIYEEVQLGPIVSYGQHILPLAGKSGGLCPGPNGPPRALIGKLNLILYLVVDHEEIKVLVILVPCN